MATYHAKDLPNTPLGKHKDISGLNKDDYVQVTTEVAFKVGGIRGVKYIEEREDSDSNYEFDPIYETQKEKDNSLINSPFIERRKSKLLKSPSKSPNESQSVLDVSTDLLGVSDKYLELYEENKKSCSLREADILCELDVIKKRNSLPIMESNHIEIDQVENMELKKLESALIDSKMLLENLTSNLKTQVKEWKEILITEKNIPKDDQGEVESLIGKSEILLKKRVKNTFDLIDKADEYFNRGGCTIESDDKHYVNEDIYGFVDLAKNELLKLTDDFKKVQQRRIDDWPIVDSNEEFISKPNVENKPPKKKNLIKRSKTTKAVSRINIKEMQRLSKEKLKTDKLISGIQFMGGNTKKISKVKDNHKSTPDTAQRVTRSQNVSHDSNSFTSPNISVSRNPVLSRSFRDHSRIISETGATVHADTPRPMKQQNSSVNRPKRSSIQSKELNDSSADNCKDSFVKPNNSSFQLLKSGNKKRTRASNCANISNGCDTDADLSCTTKRLKLNDNE